MHQVSEFLTYNVRRMLLSLNTCLCILSYVCLRMLIILTYLILTHLMLTYLGLSFLVFSKRVELYHSGVLLDAVSSYSHSVIIFSMSQYLQECGRAYHESVDCWVSGLVRCLNVKYSLTFLNTCSSIYKKHQSPPSSKYVSPAKPPHTYHQKISPLTS